MYDKFIEFLKGKHRLCIIQAENPDGDSVGSAIALDYILKDSENTMFCPVDIPRYLHYYPDWSRIDSEFDWKADGYIIVDTASEILLSRLLEDSAIRNCLYTKPVFVLDHHVTEDDLSFPHEAIIESLPACADLIYKIAKAHNLPINKIAASALYAAIAADTLGLVSPAITADTMYDMGDLIALGAEPAVLEEERREYIKRSQHVMRYKATLIDRTEFFLDGRLAMVHIPFNEIQEYSDEYNPNILILEELRLVRGVDVAIAVKTYPDGKVTGKVRTTKPFAEIIAGYFGGGGHPYAAGFRTYDTSYSEVEHDVIKMLPDLLKEYKGNDGQQSL